MNGNRLITVLVAIIFVGAVVGSFFFGRTTVKDTHAPTTKIERDTIIIRDTVRESYPAAVDKKKVGSVVVKAPVVATPAKDKARDTVYIRDTVWVELSMEEREYKGMDYRAVVGGYNPYLKSIEVYPTTEYITKTETVTKRKRWGVSIGLQGGYGITPKGWQPYAGLGVTFGYNF
ncbi:MAG: hypothetical protein IKB15_07515 [Alistipes sp.]|nr:hypothetical protein [Alistipes sp.]